MCKEKIKASKKKWRENNPDKVKIHNETYRQTHKKEINKRNRQWQIDNKEKYNKSQNRRVKKHYKLKNIKLKLKKATTENKDIILNNKIYRYYVGKKHNWRILK